MGPQSLHTKDGGLRLWEGEQKRDSKGRNQEILQTTTAGGSRREVSLQIHRRHVPPKEAEAPEDKNLVPAIQRREQNIPQQGPSTSLLPTKPG